MQPVLQTRCITRSAAAVLGGQALTQGTGSPARPGAAAGETLKHLHLLFGGAPPPPSLLLPCRMLALFLPPLPLRVHLAAAVCCARCPVSMPRV